MKREGGDLNHTEARPRVGFCRRQGDFKVTADAALL